MTLNAQCWLNKWYKSICTQCVCEKRQNVIPQIMLLQSVFYLYSLIFLYAALFFRLCSPVTLLSHPLPHSKIYAQFRAAATIQYAYSSSYGCHHFLTSVEIIIRNKPQIKLMVTIRTIVLSLNFSAFRNIHIDCTGDG